VRQVHHHVPPAIELAPGPFEHVRAGFLARHSVITL
jgi:hypothetical protein